MAGFIPSSKICRLTDRFLFGVHRVESVGQPTDKDLIGGPFGSWQDGQEETIE